MGKWTFIILSFMLDLAFIGCQNKSAEPPPVKYWDLTGRVINLSDNSPIIGANVYFAGDSTATDSSGNYGFRKIIEGKYQIIVKAEDYGEYGDSILLIQQMTHDIPLSRILTVFGQVRGLHNEYIRGSVVTVGDKSDTTDDGGYYALSLVPKGVTVITCHHPDYFSFEDTLHVARGHWRINLRLTGIMRISGQVFDSADKYIEGAVVSLNDECDTTDNSGSYNILTAESYIMIMNCTHPGYQKFVDTLNIQPGQYIRDIYMTIMEHSRDTILDTIYIQEDASVKDIGRELFGPFDPIRRQNFGQNGDIDVSCSIWTEYLMMDDSISQIPYLVFSNYWAFLKIPPVPDSMTIVSGTLEIFAWQTMHMGSDPGYLRVTEALGDWQEDSITWLNKPECSSGDTIIEVTQGSFVNVDVGGFYRGTKYTRGLVIKPYPINPPPMLGFFDEFTIFSSAESDSSVRPRVIIKCVNQAR